MFRSAFVLFIGLACAPQAHSAPVAPAAPNGSRLLAEFKFEAAAAAFKQALTAAPERPLLWSELGWALLRYCEPRQELTCPELEEAEQAEQRARALTHEDRLLGAIEYNRGRIAAARHDLTAAAAHYRESLKLRPKNSTVTHALARLEKLPLWAALAGLDSGGDGSATFDISRPVEFQSRAGVTLSAALVRREWSDDVFDADRDLSESKQLQDLVLVVARKEGGALVKVVVYSFEREVVMSRETDMERTARLHKVPLGNQLEALRIDIEFDYSLHSHDHYIRTLLASVSATSELTTLLERRTLSENTSGEPRREARLSFRDLDGDGTNELLVDESEFAGGLLDPGNVHRRVRLKYQLKAGEYKTTGRSLFPD